jgi:hypothetical protein
MSVTLSTLNKTIDNAFMTLLTEVQEDLADNVLRANPITALLRAKGCFKTQLGGKQIERSIKYALGPKPETVQKGSTLTATEVENKTAAYWNYERTTAQSIVRSLMDDAAYVGPLAIRDYIKDRTSESIESLQQKLEGDNFRAHVTDESGLQPQGLGDLVPPPATRTTGTYGNIARPSNYTNDVPDAGNIYWSPVYKTITDPVEVNLLDDMRNMYHRVTKQMEKPDIILTSQTLYELFESFGSDAIQITQSTGMLALGFDAFKFKGADLFYSDFMASGSTLESDVDDGSTTAYGALTHAMLFLNSRWIECIYHPMLWFSPTEWKFIHNQLERYMQILVRWTMITKQPRRHGLMYKS